MLFKYSNLIPGVMVNLLPILKIFSTNGAILVVVKSNAYSQLPVMDKSKSLLVVPSPPPSLLNHACVSLIPPANVDLFFPKV